MTEKLSKYFEGVASKKLSAVEVDSKRSNQHEFNGTVAMQNLLGADRKQYLADFIYLSDDEPSCAACTGNLTWYDARENIASRTEYRLYFPNSIVMKQAKEKDTLIIGSRVDGTLLIIVAEAESAIERQLCWLFSIQNDMPGFVVNNIEGSSADHVIDFSTRSILQSFGISVLGPSENILELVREKYPDNFPSTAEFSEFARNTSSDMRSSQDDPDAALIFWIKWEEDLFRALEKHEIDKRLRTGFEDSDEFVSYSLSVHNRRKSRAGRALENHIEQILIEHAINYSRDSTTEYRVRPDFLFPGIDEYRNPEFSQHYLTMLGVKNTCKDRWRQILTEARRISKKHLLTLETHMSENQTGEINGHKITLVLPLELHRTYTENQRQNLMSVKEFIDLVLSRQKGARDT